MPGEMSYLPVNWIDGMKISRTHFEATGLYTESIARDVAALGINGFNYGILPLKPAFDLRVSCDFNQQINVILAACQAVTPGGFRISVAGEEPVTASANFKEIAGRYNLTTAQTRQLLLVLSVNPFKRNPAGEPLMEETPPRHPFTRPDIRLDLVPAETLLPAQLGGSLVIGRIDYQNGELQIQKEFIPACTAVESLPALTAWFKTFRDLLDNWEQYCVRIIQKINSRTQTAQPNLLANNILKLSEKMLEQLVRQKISFQWTFAQQPPVFFCSALMENIYYAQAAQQFYGEKDREEMLNYFAEWTDTAPGALEKQTAQLFGLTYHHNDIAGTLTMIHQTYQSYVLIFLKLSQLDFIGKKKGQNIFVIEQEVKPVNPPPTPKQNSRWSPLT